MTLDLLTAPHRPSTGSAPSLLDRYRSVRNTTEWICQPLTTEDCVVQTAVECSPVKWQLGHTTWFFETFVLKPYAPGYTEYHSRYSFLFNSYYNAIGERVERDKRGLMSRPTMDEVWSYRRAVDEAIEQLLQSNEELSSNLEAVVTLGLNHEQQHQELILTDVKTVLAMNPLEPVYRPRTVPTPHTSVPLQWVSIAGGLHEIGMPENSSEFCFDNEGPRHRVFLEDFRIANRLVTNGEYLEFMVSGGYRDARHWLADGWARVVSEGWKSPKYWREEPNGEWLQMTLSGLRPVEMEEPVTHISHYEADAFAAWAGARLATEFEWEIASRQTATNGNFLEDALFHPAQARPQSTPLLQMFGDAWEWTSSAYLPYPRYRVAEGALGEYNGKFMSNQMVLRGGSCVTPRDHIRATYRNFFPPESRWQFTGIRLAKHDLTR